MRKNLQHISRGLKLFRLRMRWIWIDKEYIAMSAIWFNDGQIHENQPQCENPGFAVCGRRHHNCWATKSVLSGGLKPSEVRMPSGDTVNLALLPGPRRVVQGFVTSKNRFLNRVEAAKLAKQCGQILWWVPGDELISEEIY